MTRGHSGRRARGLAVWSAMGSLIVALMSVSGATPAAAAAEDLCARATVPDGMTRFDWTGAAGTSAWRTDGNWRATGRRNGAVAPNYFGKKFPGSDDSLTGFVCIDPLADDQPGDSLAVELDGGVNANLLSVHVAGDTDLTLGKGSKLLVWGGPGDYETRFDAETDLSVESATLGGSGVVLADGDVAWLAVPGGSTFNNGYCDRTPALAACRAVHPPGKLVISADATLAVSGRGVQLRDGYQLEVAGKVLLTGQGYIAADRDTTITITPSGTFEIANDGSLFEGFANGVPSPGLADFVNQGRLVKSDGDGTSAVVASYSGDGSVEVRSGSLEISGGANAPADVGPDASFGTARCNESDACVPRTTPEDPLAASLDLPDPAADADGADVLVDEVEADSDPLDDVQPPIDIAVGGLDPGAEARITFAFDRTIRRLPRQPTDLLILRKRSGTEYETIPLCGDVGGGGPSPNGVTACIDSRGKTTSGVAVVVRAVDADGSWVARSLAPVVRTAVPTDRRVSSSAPDPAFDYDDRRDAQRGLDGVALTDTACGMPSRTTWNLETRFRRVNTDSHGLSWSASRRGTAYGLRAPVGDLQGALFEIGLRVERGTLRGLVRVVRYESGSVRWEGTAVVGRRDLTDPGLPGEPGWRILSGAPLTFSWSKFDGSAVVESGIRSTIPDLIRTYDVDRQPGAPGDTAAFGFGCRGERVVVDDLRVFRSGDRVDDQWDLEPPAATVNFVGPQANPACQVSRVDYPWQSGRRVDPSRPGPATLFFYPAGKNQPSRRTKLRFRRGGEQRLTVPVRETGNIVLRLDPTAAARGAVSDRVRVAAAPVVSFSSFNRRITWEQTLTLRGRIRPDGRRQVRLYRVTQGKTVLEPVKGASIRTDRRGNFAIRWNPPNGSARRYGLAVEVVGARGLSTAMSRVAVVTRVVKPPPDPPPPVAVPPQPDDYAQLDDPIIQLRQAEARGACEYVLNRPLG